MLMRERESGCDVLMRALSARGLTPTAVHDEPDVMMGLAALADRGAERRVLIVVDPARWQRLSQLVQAVHDFHGSVHCWQFDRRDGVQSMLSQLEVTPEGHDQAGDKSGVGPIGRIRKRNRPVDRLLVKPGREELATREVVTQQELTMLLGPAPGEAG